MYRWVDHTAEVELSIAAATQHEVFADAMTAFAELLGFGPGSGERAERQIVAAGPDRPALLAAWLEELVFAAESEGFVALSLVELNLELHRLTATVAGVLDEPPPLVKAVTYHRLSFEAVDGGYRATVVLDV